MENWQLTHELFEEFIVCCIDWPPPCRSPLPFQLLSLLPFRRPQTPPHSHFPFSLPENFRPAEKVMNSRDANTILSTRWDMQWQRLTMASKILSSVCMSASLTATSCANPRCLDNSLSNVADMLEDWVAYAFQPDNHKAATSGRIARVRWQYSEQCFRHATEVSFVHGDSSKMSPSLCSRVRTFVL